MATHIEKLDKIILIGAGGHCKSCIDVIEEEGKFKIEGILDVKRNNLSVLNYPIIGNDDLIPGLCLKKFSFLITVGQIKSASLRIKLHTILLDNKANLPSIISPRAHVSRHAKIGKGTIIHHNCIVNAGAEIGANCIVNSGSIVEHDSVVGNHCHISTNTIINGDCIIGDEVFIGSGTVVSNGISIEKQVVVGAGSLVLKDISKAGIYYSKFEVHNK